MVTFSATLWLIVILAAASEAGQKEKQKARRQKESDDYAADKRVLWAHRWFFDTKLFPRIELTLKQQQWWGSLASYKEPGKTESDSIRQSTIENELDQLMQDASDRRKRRADTEDALKRKRRQSDDDEIDYEKLKELSDQFLADWFDTDKYPATELTYRQKEYMGLGLGAYNLKTIDDDTDDENQKEGCTYVDTPAWQRMEWRRISADTRASFIDALKKLAVFYPDSKATESGLDIFVKMHRFLNMPGGIRGASLLPLNREYLFRFSNALREQGYKAALPYWDPTLESELPDPTDSVIWCEDNLGTAKGEVGKPFEFIQSIKECKKKSHLAFVYRNAVNSPMKGNLLFTSDDVKSVLSKKCYSDLTWLWDAEFESHINNGHIFFGKTEESQMADPNCAPTDPLYWLYSAFVDLIWEEYRNKKQDEITRQVEYPKEKTGLIPSAMSWYSRMDPFGSNPNIYGLSNHYTTYFYSYEERLSTIRCKLDTDCDPEENGYLWCNVESKSCHTKIKEKGKCKKGLPNDQCYCSDASQTPQCKKKECICT